MFSLSYSFFDHCYEKFLGVPSCWDEKRVLPTDLECRRPSQVPQSLAPSEGPMVGNPWVCRPEVWSQWF